MKRSLLQFTVFLLLATAGTTQAGGPRNLILVAGQSNAVGFDAYAAELPADSSDKDVLFWWRCGDPPPDEHDSTSARHWTHLQPQPVGNPILRDTKDGGEAGPKLARQYGNFRKPEGGFGPEMGLARELHREENQPLAIVKVAFSGTGMRTDWNPQDAGDGGACYRALVEETKAAILAAREQGIEFRLRALVWVQGESDANAQDAPEYERALSTLLAALRRDLEAPQLPALLGVNTHFGNDKNPFIPKVIEAQRAIATQDRRCAYVDTAPAETLLPTRTHFTAAGTLDVGQRFARALLALEAAAAPK
ncbi:MAG: sialate O-acetylesterase [Chthoniobacter sp.]|uniref:sialate O-acetylesterase n=1 Tax=Chthoniobacter sp. TaxID=2510640 RepID=UPI0032AD4872